MLLTETPDLPQMWTIGDFSVICVLTQDNY